MKEKLIPFQYIVIFLALIVFFPALDHGFLTVDDPLYVTQNETIRAFSAENIRRWFTHSYVKLWIPVTMASYALDYSVWRNTAFGYHFTNLILHLINILLIYGLLVRTGNSRTASFIAACIFALHPLQAESVVWIAERKNLLAFMFFVLSLHSWEEWLDSGKSRHSIPAVLFFGLSLLSKPAAVLCPVLYLVRCYQKKNADPHLWILFILMFFLSLVSVCMTLYGHALADGFQEPHDYTDVERLFTWFSIPLYYLKNYFYPLSLSIYYLPETLTSILSFKVLAGIAFIVLTVFLLCREARKLSMNFYWMSWVILVLLPVSSIIPFNTWMNDRYMYFALAPASVILINFCQGRAIFRNMLFLLIPFLCLMTCSQVKIWETSASLFNASLKRQPGAYQIKIWSLFSLYREKDYETLEAYISDILEKQPFSPQAVYYRQLLLVQAGKAEEARGLVMEALKTHPENPLLNRIMGNFRMKAGDYEEAGRHYSRIPATDREYGPALLDQVRILIEQKNYAPARRISETALSLIPREPEIFNLSGVAAFRAGDYSGAVRSWTNGLKKHPYHKGMRENLVTAADHFP